jgi:cysteine desulfurase
MASTRPIYLDSHATTPLDPRVFEQMSPWFMERFGNPASKLHSYGWEAESGVEVSRRKLASTLGAPSDALVFTSSATEANQLVILGLVPHLVSRGRKKILSLPIEHSSVLAALDTARTRGMEVLLIPVDSSGRVDLSALRQLLDETVGLVSIAWANHEVGTLQPIREIAEICRSQGVLLHSDAVQAFGKVAVEMKGADTPDFVTLSAHKIYGPKGVGALVAKNHETLMLLTPQSGGGSQEFGLRAGTHNVPAIVGLATAAELSMTELSRVAPQMAALRDKLWSDLLQKLGPAVRRNGCVECSLPHSLNVTFLGIDGAALFTRTRGIAVSNASACLNGKQDYSQVLVELGATQQQAKASMRLALSPWTTIEEIEAAGQIIVHAVRDLLKFENSLQERRAGT